MTPTLHCYRGYVFRIEYDAEDPAYIVDFPDIPDIITNGTTLTEAFGHACEALDLYLEALDKLGRPSPKARHQLVLTGSETA
jgi:predicted RNase H-like HicB family nuclease